MGPPPSETTGNKTSDAVKNLIEAGFKNFSLAPFSYKLKAPPADVVQYTQDKLLAGQIEDATKPVT